MRKNILPIIIIIILLFLASCKGCGGCFYKVHENEEHLNILISDSNVSSADLLKSFDADLKPVNKNYDISDSIDGVKLSNDYERVIHFKFPPEEYYYISINTSLCKILAVYNEKSGVRTGCI